MKASDLLVHCLEREGITRVFGVPEEENADLMISLEDSPIEFVLTRHEQGAAFMAEVCGRLSGSPAVCLGTLGPGAINLYHRPRPCQPCSWGPRVAASRACARSFGKRTSPFTRSGGGGTRRSGRTPIAGSSG